MIEAALDERLIRIEARLAALEGAPGNPAGAIEPESRIAWRHGRRPKFWPDVEVRRHIINRHRQTTIVELHAEMLTLFGRARTPSTTAMALLWKRIDQTTAARRRAA